MTDIDVEPLQPDETAPDFGLPDAEGLETYLTDALERGPAVVVFTCNGCEHSQAYEDRLIQLQSDYIGKGVRVVAVNPNPSTGEADESVEAMNERAKLNGFNFDYLKDEDQSVARAFGAQATPHAFVVDTDRTVVYQGRIDDAWKEPDKVMRPYVREALDLLLGESDQDHLDTESTIPVGCKIVWGDGDGDAGEDAGEGKA